MSKRVPHQRCCPCGAKHSFSSEREADKELGRVQTKRKRTGDATGTRRGLRIENRVYECEYGHFHLAAESRRQFNERTEAWV